MKGMTCARPVYLTNRTSAFFAICLALFCAVACDRHNVAGNKDLTPVSKPSTVVADPIQGVSFIGNEHAWLVTSEGNLLRTSDSGGSWAKMPGLVENHLRNVAFFDSANGYAVDSQNRILRTTDAGESWSPRSKIPELIIKIGFSDEWRGWAIDPFAVWRTDDGAATWRRVQPSRRPLAVPRAVYSLGEGMLWAGCTEGVLYTSADDGFEWREQKIANGDIKDMFFVNPQVGWLALSNSREPHAPTLYGTRDGGQTWGPHFVSGIEDGHFTAQSIQFLNEGEGWAVGVQTIDSVEGEKTKSVIAHTSDGGQKWRITYRSDQDEDVFLRVYFADRHFGWIVADDKLFTTNDGGSTLTLSLDLSSLSQTSATLE